MLLRELASQALAVRPATAPRPYTGFERDSGREVGEAEEGAVGVVIGPSLVGGEPFDEASSRVEPAEAEEVAEPAVAISASGEPRRRLAPRIGAALVVESMPPRQTVRVQATRGSTPERVAPARTEEPVKRAATVTPGPPAEPTAGAELPASPVRTIIDTARPPTTLQSSDERNSPARPQSPIHAAPERETAPVRGADRVPHAAPSLTRSFEPRATGPHPAEPRPVEPRVGMPRGARVSERPADTVPVVDASPRVGHAEPARDEPRTGQARRTGSARASAASGAARQGEGDLAERSVMPSKAVPGQPARPRSDLVAELQRPAPSATNAAPQPPSRRDRDEESSAGPQGEDGATPLLRRPALPLITAATPRGPAIEAAPADDDDNAAARAATAPLPTSAARLAERRADGLFEPAGEPRASAPAPAQRVVRVQVGRVIVRAPPAHTRAEPAAVQRPAARMSLNDYLSRRDGRGGPNGSGH